MPRIWTVWSPVLCAVLFTSGCANGVADVPTKATPASSSGTLGSQPATVEDGPVSNTTSTFPPPPSGVPAEMEARFNDCLRSHGFERRQLSEDVWAVDVPPEQTDIYLAAQTTCAKEAGFLTDEPVAPPSPEYLDGYYTALLETATCLIDRGHQVPEPPSREAFIEAGGSAWHPYDVIVDTLTQAGWNVVNAICPQPTGT